MSNVNPDIFLDEPLEEEYPEHFKIDGLKTADWAMRMLNEKRAWIKEVTELHAYEVWKLDQWKTAELEKMARGTNFFEALLRNWHEEQLAANPNSKTISLPTGKLTARKTQETVDVTDSFVFNQWAAENQPSWVKTTHTPIKSEIKKAVTPTVIVAEDGEKITAVIDPDGQIVPGVAPVPADISFKAVSA